MKFSDIDRKEWFKLQPYLDTCVLPVTGLDGTEEPWEAVQELEFLRSLLEFVEIPYKGRTVTYPALHYVNYDSPSAETIDRVCEGLKKSGFRYVIVMTGLPDAVSLPLVHADVVLCPQDENGRTLNSEAFKAKVDESVRRLWKSGSPEQPSEDETKSVY
jgi:23S rRNA (pseudouridine1915-N3)-methyltransferase